MYLSVNEIAQALRNLETMHTFYGTTFLVLKKHNIPIGSAIPFPLIEKDREFLEQYYRPCPESKYFYRVSRTSAGESKHWLEPKYPGGGLQKIRTEEPLRRAFIHEKRTKLWGWQTNYVDVLRTYLYQGRPIPAYYLAVWLYREKDWPENTTPEAILWTFLDEFNISQQEREILFSLVTPRQTDFQKEPVTWRQLQRIIKQLPPDAPKEEGGILAYLELKGIGPSPYLEFVPGRRINLITGDNGLGKSFLLECAWWALTSTWAGRAAFPHTEQASISFQLSGEHYTTPKILAQYDWSSHSWPSRPDYKTIPGILVYARADGSFAIWDPVRFGLSARNSISQDFIFDADEIWNGKRSVFAGKNRYICNGLIQDWISWYNAPDRYPFGTFTRILELLSPDELGTLRPGQPTRLPDDSREIPTLQMPYGTVPIVYAAAGVRRILALAYLIVWTWVEHVTQSQLAHKRPQRHMVVLIDEIEAHLHPRWQRLILPALLEAQKVLDEELEIQFIIATHSPLVAASIESIVDNDLDRLFRLDLVQSNLGVQQAVLEKLDFVRRGPVDAWLTSDAFELDQPRAIQAEHAIEEAKKLQLQEYPHPEQVRKVTDLLLASLAEDDAFWVRWIWFAEQHGIKL